jgi:hypothetical protein
MIAGYLFQRACDFDWVLLHGRWRGWSLGKDLAGKGYEMDCDGKDFVHTFSMSSHVTRSRLGQIHPQKKFLAYCKLNASFQISRLNTTD